MEKNKARFYPVKEIKELLKQQESVGNKLNSYDIMHCNVCGDTTPKHGFYPLWGMTIGEGFYQTSGYTCNRCNYNNEDYERIFKEPKEVI